MCRSLLLSLSLIALVACSTEAPDTASQEPKEDLDVVSQLRSDIEAFQARAEHTEPKVRVQHILISFQGAPRMPPSVTRSMEEAEALAADLYAKLKDGADFTELMSENSDDDRVVGVYTMVLSGPTVQG